MPLLPLPPRLQPAVLVPLAASLTVLMTAFAAAEEADPGAAFFTGRVEPILRERCYGCHSYDTEISGHRRGGDRRVDRHIRDRRPDADLGARRLRRGQ